MLWMTRLASVKSCKRHLTEEERLLLAEEQEMKAAAALDRDPACWSWPVPDDPYERVLPGDIGEEREWSALGYWQSEEGEGRCAICGGRDSQKVLDHDHATGLARGWICRSCNGEEAHLGRPDDMFVRWRRRPAAAVLGVRFHYVNIFGEQAGPVVENEEAALLRQAALAERLARFIQGR